MSRAEAREVEPAREPEPRAPGAEEAPPFLGSWRNVYLLLVGELALLSALFWALSRWAS